MANEELTIAQNKARLSVIGRSYADTNTESGEGPTWPDIVLEELEDMGFDLPDVDDFIIGNLDDYDWPVLIWDDGILELDGLDIGDLDLDWELDSDFTIGNLNFDVDTDFNIAENNLPASIVIVTPPRKLEYLKYQPVDITGMVVTAKKADGSTWTSAKYPNGHVPLGELIVTPNVASGEKTDSVLNNPNVGTGSLFAVINISPNSPRRFIKVNGDPAFGGAYLRDNGVYDPILVSTTSAGASYTGDISASGSPIEYDGATFYWASYGGGYVSSGGSIVSCAANLGGPLSGPDAARLALQTAGAVGGSDGKIHINWARPEDGKILSASFEVTITGGGGGR